MCVIMVIGGGSYYVFTLVCKRKKVRAHIIIILKHQVLRTDLCMNLYIFGVKWTFIIRIRSWTYLWILYWTVRIKGKYVRMFTSYRLTVDCLREDTISLLCHWLIKIYNFVVYGYVCIYFSNVPFMPWFWLTHCNALSNCLHVLNRILYAKFHAMCPWCLIPGAWWCMCPFQISTPCYQPHHFKYST